MVARSDSCKITPLGLFGEAKNIARVRGVMSASSARRSTRKPDAAGAGARTRRAPDTSMDAG